MLINYNEKLIKPIDNLDRLLNDLLFNKQNITENDYYELQRLFVSLREETLSKEYEDNLKIVNKYLNEYPILFQEMQLYLCNKAYVLKNNIPNIDEIIKENEKIINEIDQKEVNDALINDVSFMIGNHNIKDEIFDNVALTILEKDIYSKSELFFLYRFFASKICEKKGLPIVKPFILKLEKGLGKSNLKTILLSEQLLDSNNFVQNIHVVLHEVRHYEQKIKIFNDVVDVSSFSKLLSDYGSYEINPNNKTNYRYSEVETDANKDAVESLEFIDKVYLKSKYKNKIPYTKRKYEVMNMLSCYEEDDKFYIAYPKLLSLFDKKIMNLEMRGNFKDYFYNYNDKPKSINELLNQDINSDIEMISKYVIARLEMGENINFCETNPKIINNFETVKNYIENEFKNIDEFIDKNKYTKKELEVINLNCEYYKRNIKFLNYYIKKISNIENNNIKK